ncbi:protein FAR1-RELATED SEQUENCE 5-like [Primulina eburnea]|uniref:protein FAR1-RELATED SEQUENCE 5-like n=1 Tax=Primulina eburnea TaxID=1245227 RepID=UPI003C6C178F
MRLLEIQYGGLEHVGCTERDIRNFEKKLRDEQKGIDAETLIEFFASEKDKNYSFFFDYETYSDKRFSMCFWADPVSRRENSVFSDIVVFDTTYNTNKYEAMPKGAPNVIITDQDPDMAKAIAQVFHKTVHRYCLWNILNKFPDKLNPMTFLDYYRSIKNVIQNSTTPDEFEKSWEDVIKCANLEKNDWLSLMYELRQKWVPIYFNHIFCAGMSSSQRSEISHAFLKRYVSNKNSLMDFIACFNRALRHQRHNELVADHTDMNEHPKIKTNWPMEAQMVKVYTKKKYVEFQSEMCESHGYYVQQVSVGVELMVYNVMNFQTCSSSKSRTLTHNKQLDYILLK